MDDLYNGPCEAGCQHYHGGEVRHTPGCGHYPESLTKAFEDRIEALEAENERLQHEVPLFPEHMASVLAAKRESLQPRVTRITEAMEKLPEYFRRYQWQADNKQAFGEKFIRSVAGDSGRGMGRQWIATTPQHIDGLAEYIAAASPDTVALLIAENARLREAAKPFVAYAGAPGFDKLPPDTQMTKGSAISRRQVHAGDFHALRAAIKGETT